MKFEIKENKSLREKYYFGQHESGLKVYFIPKNQAVTYALFSTMYGSMDNTFKTKKEGDYITVPDGIAHFLEHKMFENADGEDTFLKFSKLGASCNAYTSNEVTSYLFSSPENYTESLEVLLEFVTSPYFTKENVKKEMGIIEQELKMYDDNPNRWLYQELLLNLYEKNPVRIPIGGTVQSIHKITSDILYDCYNTFYNLNNMVLIIAGNMTLDDIQSAMDKKLKKAPDVYIEKFVPEEPAGVYEKFSQKAFPIAMPLFVLGIKEKDMSGDGREKMKRSFEHLIILEILFGKSCDFYEELYSKGLINSKFSASYQISSTYGYITIQGESENFKEVKDLVVNHINAYVKGEKKIDKIKFECVKRVLYSDTLQSWNSTSDIAESFLDCLICGADMMDMPLILDSITMSDIENRLKKSYDTELLTQVVATVKEKEKA